MDNGSSAARRPANGAPEEVGPYAQIPVWMTKHKLNGTEWAVLIALRSFASGRLGSRPHHVFPKVSTVAERANVSLRSAERAMTRLRELGLFTSTRWYSPQGDIAGCNYYLTDLPAHGVPTNLSGRPGESDGTGTASPDGAEVDQDEVTSGSHQPQPMVDDTPVGVRASAPTAPEEPRRRDEHWNVRLSGLSYKAKVQKLMKVWVAVMQSHGVNPPERWRNDIGRQVKQLLAEGTEDRRLLDEIRANARKMVHHERQQPGSTAFDRFWWTYPRQADLKRARDAWAAALWSGVREADLLTAACNYARAKMTVKRNELPYPHTWLNTGQWKQWVPGVRDAA